MPGGRGSRFEVRSLWWVLRGLEAGDLEALFDVYASNPGYLELTEGSGGEPGRYDAEMLQRDLGIAAMTPGRRMVGVFLEASGELVGVLDWMEENPSDGVRWVGLIMIRADRQGQGLASEVFEALAERLRAGNARAVRTAVIERNPPGRAFARRLGFQEISRPRVRLPSDEDEVIVLERLL